MFHELPQLYLKIKSKNLNPINTYIFWQREVCDKNISIFAVRFYLFFQGRVLDGNTTILYSVVHGNIC
jgi:hypothetical protein